MSVSLNKVLLLGTLAAEPVAGERSTVGRLCIEEAKDGEVFRTWIPLEAYGRSAQVLATLREGAACLIDGKLAWKRGEPDAQGNKRHGQVIVLAFSVQALGAAPAAAPLLRSE